MRSLKRESSQETPLKNQWSPMKNLKREGSSFKWYPNVKLLKSSLNKISSKINIKNKISTDTLFLKGEKSNYINKNDSMLDFLHFNIIEIISVFDSSGNRWYEVDYLAQSKIPEEIHYTDESTRTSAYFNLDFLFCMSEYIESTSVCKSSSVPEFLITKSKS